MVIYSDQKITPFLWFDNNAEEAMKFYTSVFENSEILNTEYYPEGSEEEHMKGMEGKVLTGLFSLMGNKFMCLDGGPLFKFTPAVSFSVNLNKEEQTDKLWEKLSDGGKVLMEYQNYPFAKKYGWCNDKYGVSWQVMLGEGEPKITPSLLFTKDKVGKAMEAMEYYTSLFPDSEIVNVAKYEEGEGDTVGNVKFGLFKLAGQEFIAMESGLDHAFTFNEAVSFYVNCEDQAEVDKLWEKLSAVPESEQCGWCKDKYGVSWQIVPVILGELMEGPDKARKGKVMEKLMKMKKLNVKDLEDAYKE